jgi:hypothetical protein
MTIKLTRGAIQVAQDAVKEIAHAQLSPSKRWALYSEEHRGKRYWVVVHTGTGLAARRNLKASEARLLIEEFEAVKTPYLDALGFSPRGIDGEAKVELRKLWSLLMELVTAGKIS